MVARAQRPATEDLLLENERLQRELQAYRARCAEQEASLRHADQVLEQARQMKERANRYVLAMAEAFEAVALTELRRDQGLEIARWDVEDWGNWLLRTHLQTMHRYEAAGTARAANELKRLQEENRRLADENARLQQAMEASKGQAEREVEPVSHTKNGREATLPRNCAPGQAEAAEELPPLSPLCREAGSESSLRPEETERRFGQYWGRFKRERVDATIRVLAQGEEFRRKQVIEATGTSWGGRCSDLVDHLLDSGFVEAVKASLGPGNPTALLLLTGKGMELAEALGTTPRRGLPAMLKRHHSERQSLLALLAREVLAGWGYTVDLWPEQFRTASGKRCDPDVVARSVSGRTIYVELEVDPLPKTGKYERNDARVNKWRIFHEVNDGYLYVVTPSPEGERKMLREVVQWRRVTRVPVVLCTANVFRPGVDWQRQQV